MADYRLPELDLSTRIMIVSVMLRPIPKRKWGRATELAQTYDVSRAFLYDLRKRALDVLIEGLSPRTPGPQPQEGSLVIDAAFIQRAITVMPMLKGTVRDIQHGLRLLFGVQRSVGYINQTLTAAGEQATAYNLSVTVLLPILGEDDEIFQGWKPCLTPVDGRSFLVVNLTPAESRDGATWGVTYLDLVERGIQFHDLACDGGTGLRAGVKEAQLAIPLRPDLFHILQDAHRLTRRLEGAAYQAMETAERARRADLEARGIIRRRGRRLKIKVPLPQAEIEETKAIEVCDNWCWLLGEVRLALEPLTPTHGIISVAETKVTIETAIELLKGLPHPDIIAFAEDLEEKMPELVAPLEWLEQHLTPVLDGLDADAEAFILWAWQHRHELNLDIDTDIPERLRPVVRAVWDTLRLFRRSSSLAESVGCKASAHSWLRPCRFTGACPSGCSLCCSSSGTTTRSNGASERVAVRWNWQEWKMYLRWQRCWISCSAQV
jgi:hypothetical protein